MSLKKYFATCAVSISLGFGIPALHAQGIVTGSVTGTIQDPTGAVVPGATITATNPANGATFTATASNSGGFSLSQLPVGLYNLTITSAGFSDLKVQNVAVETGKSTGLGVEKLSTGSAVETVEVSTAQNLLETVQSQVTTTFDTQQLQNLPTGGGFDELALLIPGVVSTHADNFANTNGAGISSNGQRGRSNNFEIDGQSNNDNSVTGPQVFFSNEDALQEVQIITNQFSAQYGRDAGSVINYVTKSGTNKFHGTAFEYYSGSWLNSLTTAQKSPYQGFCHAGETPSATNPCIPVKRPRSDNNVFGGSFGGPILRDRLFGFGSLLMGRNYSGATPSVSGSNNYTPTPDSIKALQAKYPNNPGIQSLALFGPFSVAAGNPTLVGAPVNAVVNDGTTNSTTIQLSQYSRFFAPYSTNREILGKLDYQATSKDRFYLRYFYQKNPSIGASGNILTGGFVNVNDKVHSVGTDWTHTFSPRLTNQLRYSFQQSNLTFDGGGFSACTITSLGGCPSNFGIDGTTLAIVGGGTVTTGGFGLQTNLPQGRIVKDTQVQDNLNYVWGKHSIALGASFEYQNSPNVFLPTISGGYNFAGLNGLFSGQGTLTLAAGDANIHFTEPDWAAYIQDDWKISPSLTVNLGMRWEYFQSSINLLHDVSLKNQTGATPLWNTALPQSTTVFPQINEDRKHFEPRLGFAFNPSGLKALVVRGGYSVNIAPAFYNIFLNSYSSAPVLVSATVNCNGVCIPTGGSTYTTVHAQDTQYVPTGGNPGSFNQTLVPKDFRQPYTQTYSLGAQYQVKNIAVVEVRYVGAHTVGDFQSLNANPNLGSVSALFPNLVPASSICTAAASAAQAFPLKGSPDVGHVHCGQTNVRVRANTAYEIYNGLQTQLTTRNYHGMTANLGYTFSRTIDNSSEVFGTNGGGSTIAFAQNPLDPNVSERGVSGQSYPNVTSLGLTYVSPFFSRDHSLIGKVLGGFQFNTIYLFNSGEPFTPYQLLQGASRGASFCDRSFASSFAGADTCRPILANASAPINTVGYNSGSGVYKDVTTGAVVARSSEHWLINNQAEAITLGNPFPGVSRNSLRGNSYNNMDASLYKNTHITERFNLQLRFQVYNVLNRNYFGAPDVDVDHANAGNFLTFNNSAGSRRTTTVGARVIF
jgi:hypothetical protein